jgi:hypothetical protein
MMADFLHKARILGGVSNRLGNREQKPVNRAVAGRSYPAELWKKM